MSEQMTVTKNTGLSSAIGNSTFDFGRIDGWERIEEHIHVHKYLLDREREAEVAWDDVIESWKKSIFTPLLVAVEDNEVRALFPGRKVGDIYLEVSDHWHYLKQTRPNASPATAAESYANRYGNHFVSFLRKAGNVLLGTGRHRWAPADEVQRRIDHVRTESQLLPGSWQ